MSTARQSATGGSAREEQFARLWECVDPQFCGRRPFVREFAFHGERKWRFDFAWPGVLVAVEIEGGTHARRGGRRSRHTTAAGHRADCEKYNAAAVAGWCVLKYTSADLDQRPVQVIAEVIAAIRGAEHVQELQALAERGGNPKWDEDW